MTNEKKPVERKRSFILSGPRGSQRRYFGTTDTVALKVFHDLVKLWGVKGDDLRSKSLLDVVDIMKKGRMNWECLGWMLVQA